MDDNNNTNPIPESNPENVEPQQNISENNVNPVPIPETPQPQTTAPTPPAPEVTPAPVTELTAAPEPNQKGTIEKFKYYIVRWLPLAILFEILLKGMSVITFGIPMIFISFASIWASGILYTVWSVFYLLSLIAALLFYIIAFNATYKRKPNAYNLVRFANIAVIALTVLDVVAGKVGIVGAAFYDFWPVLTLIAIKQYRNFFDPAVSGEKGMCMGSVPPSKKEKTIVVIGAGATAVYLVITMLVVGFFMTLAAGGAAAAGMIAKPFFIGQSKTINTTNNNNSQNDIDEEPESFSGTKKINKVSEIESSLTRLNVPALQGSYLWPKETMSTINNEKPFELAYGDNFKGTIYFKKDWAGETNNCFAGNCTDEQRSQLKSIEGVGQYQFERWKSIGTDLYKFKNPTKEEKVISEKVRMVSMKSDNEYGYKLEYFIIIKSAAKPGEFYLLEIDPENFIGKYVTKTEVDKIDADFKELVSKIANSIVVN